MKLRKFRTDLPIEAVEHVTRILGMLIVNVKDKSFLLGSDDFNEYNETVQELKRDLQDCFKLYDDWQYEDNAAEYQEALGKMHGYLMEARSTLAQATQSLH